MAAPAARIPALPDRVAEMRQQMGELAQAVLALDLSLTALERALDGNDHFYPERRKA